MGKGSHDIPNKGYYEKFVEVPLPDKMRNQTCLPTRPYSDLSALYVWALFSMH